MADIGKPERATQNRVAQLCCNELGYRYLSDWAVPAPELSLDHGGLWVTFHFPPAAGGAEAKTPVETLVEIPLKTPDQILRVLRQQPTGSLASLAQAIGKSPSAVKRAAARLVKSGQLRRAGSTKTGQWEVLHD